MSYHTIRRHAAPPGYPPFQVALGPMYLTAAASLLATVGRVQADSRVGGGVQASGGASGRLSAHLATLTTPTLWFLYLAALWLEGGEHHATTGEGEATRKHVLGQRQR